MNLVDKYTVEFDPGDRVVHIGASERMVIAAPELLNAWFSALAQILDRFVDGGRVYLTIDVNNILFDPSLAEVYAKNVRTIMEKYIYPGGIARYGFQITRVTVRRGYGDYLKESPNIFNTRAEAVAYIRGMIEKDRSGAIRTTGSAIEGDSSEH